MCVLTTEEGARLAIQKIRIKKNLKLQKKKRYIYVCVLTTEEGARLAILNVQRLYQEERDEVPRTENPESAYDVSDKDYLQRRTSVTLSHLSMTYAGVC